MEQEASVGASGRWVGCLLGIFDGKFLPCLVQTLTEKKEFLSRFVLLPVFFNKKHVVFVCIFLLRNNDLTWIDCFKEKEKARNSSVVILIPSVLHCI